MQESGLSYSTAAAANKRISHFPSGPQWKVETLTIDGYSTMEPMILYYRDAASCVEYLFNYPLFADRMNLVPVKHFTKDHKQVVTEPVSGRQAWQTQVCLNNLKILYDMLTRCRRNW